MVSHHFPKIQYSNSQLKLFTQKCSRSVAMSDPDKNVTVEKAMMFPVVSNFTRCTIHLEMISHDFPMIFPRFSHDFPYLCVPRWVITWRNSAAEMKPLPFTSKARKASNSSSSLAREEAPQWDDHMIHRENT